MSDRASEIGLQNQLGVVINPATEETLGNIEDAVYTDGSGTPSKGMLIMGTDGTNPQAVKVNSDGELVVNLETADIEISAVELKDGGTDTRATINAANTSRTTATTVVAVQGVDSAGAVLSTSALATAAKQPTLGTGLMAGSAPVTIATDDTQMGAVGAVADVDGNIHGQLRYIGEETVNIGQDVADIKTATATPTTLTSGNTTVATSGTAVTLGASLATRSIYIRAKLANTGSIYVGDLTVDAVTNQGIILAAGDSVTLDIANRTTVYVDSSVNGEGVDYVAMS